MSFSAAQCRAARALIGWSQDQLATASKVAKATIANFELGNREPYPRTLDDIREALEAAGVELTNGGQPGVRLKAGRMAMVTQKQFLDGLRLYEQHRLRSLGVIVDNRGTVEHGFVFVYKDRDGVDFMRGGKRLGQVHWAAGEIAFDPPITRSNPAHTFDDDLDQWASRAYAR